MSTEPIRVIQMGLGPIGQRLVAYLAQRRGIELVGAIDIDPAKIGKDAGLLAGTRALGVAISGEVDQGLQTPAHAVVLTTSSSFAQLAPQLASCLRAGKSVVSTCEELAFPFDSEPELAAQIHALAIEHDAVVLGTGVNPGFLMDALPLFLSSACQNVTGVKVERHQDAAIRRLPFQRKIGAGLTPVEFAAQRQAGRIRHVGFAQSIQLIARAFGWRLEKVEETVDPVIATTATASAFIQVAPGQCAGIKQMGRGFMGGREVITLDLEAYLGHPAPRDTTTIYGEPQLCSTIQGGVDGDIATCAVVLNALRSLRAAAPGLRTMADIPLTHWHA